MTTHEIHLRPFTQVLNCNPIKPVFFLGRKLACIHRGPVRFRTGFGSVHTDTQSYWSLTFPIKQTKEISFAYKIQQLA